MTWLNSNNELFINGEKMTGVGIDNFDFVEDELSMTFQFPQAEIVDSVAVVEVKRKSSGQSVATFVIDKKIFDDIPDIVIANSGDARLIVREATYTVKEVHFDYEVITSESD